MREGVRDGVQVCIMMHRRNRAVEQGAQYFSTPWKVKHYGRSRRYLRNQVRPEGTDASDINAWYSGPLGRFSAIPVADGVERKSKERPWLPSRLKVARPKSIRIGLAASKGGTVMVVRGQEKWEYGKGGGRYTGGGGQEYSLELATAKYDTILNAFAPRIGSFSPTGGPLEFQKKIVAPQWNCLWTPFIIGLIVSERFVF